MVRLFFWLQLALSLLFMKQVSAQDYPRKKYNWEENRKISYRLTDSEAKEHAVIILDSRFVDYTEDEYYKGFDLFITRHCIIRLNDDKGINEFNKVYIPVEIQDELIKLKARTITKDGIIKEVSKDNMKLLNFSKEFGNFKIFAMEGVEPGSEIEYFYTLKRIGGNGSKWNNSFMYGTEIYQGTVKEKEANFTISTPSYLFIDSKSYNDFPDLQIRKEKGLVVMHASINDIPAMSDEPYSTPLADRMKVAYKINRNSKLTDKHLYTWGSVINQYYNYLDINYLAFHVPEGLQIGGLDQDGQILAVENYVKKNIAYKAGGEDELFHIRDVIKNRLGNTWGILSVYAAIFKSLNIPFYLVVGSNRYETIFDPVFIDFQNFRQFFFYFPQSKQYLSPSCQECRYGPPPYYVANNYALFIESEEIGRLASISLLDVNHNLYRMDATVVIDSNMQTAEVKKTQIWDGYRATSLRGDYERLKEDKRNDFISQLAFGGNLNGRVLEQKAQNVQLDSANGNEQAKLVTRFVSPSLIDHAGNSYLLNVGLLIDKQEELYQKETRQSDIEMNYPMHYIRSIYVKLPNGYRVKGLEDANIDKSFNERDQRVCQFVSTSETDGEGLVINIDEYYIATIYPKERYEEFRQVINAAADFNKLQLVLEKE